MLQYQIIPVTPFAQNCTLLWDDVTLEAVLIDAGGDVPKLMRAIQEKNLTLTAIWLTHGHADHVGAAGTIAQQYQVPIIGPHKEDDFWLEQAPMVAKMYGFKETVAPIHVNQWLKHGDRLSLAGYQFEVRYTPGHTPGHIIIYSADLALVWTGDVLFVGSIGRTDFPKGDYPTLMQSIAEQVLTLPEETQFISGHGSMGILRNEKKHNPFLQ